MFHALARAGGPPDEVLIDSSAVKAHRCDSGGTGGQSQAIGRSRGGRTTKIHALTDKYCRPIAFLLTGGQVADCVAADALLDQIAEAPRIVRFLDALAQTASSSKGQGRVHALLLSHQIDFRVLA